MVDLVKMISHRKGDGYTWRPVAGQMCLISPPHSDNGDEYIYGKYEVLWLDEIFICYRAPGCWPNVDKWEHIRAKPIAPTAMSTKTQPVASEPSSGERAELIDAIKTLAIAQKVKGDLTSEARLLQAAALLSSDAKPASEPNFVDAYQGAMEEVSIWKRRAMEAEELNRRFIAEINGPMHMGEPVAVPQERS